MKIKMETERGVRLRETDRERKRVIFKEGKLSLKAEVSPNPLACFNPSFK